MSLAGEAANAEGAARFLGELAREHATRTMTPAQIGAAIDADFAAKFAQFQNQQGQKSNGG